MTQRPVYEQSLPDAEEDWFESKVNDGGWDGNECDAGGGDSSCPSSVDSPDNTIGKGCKARAARR